MGHFMEKQKILEILKKEGVKFLRLQFIDIFGICKNVEVPHQQFDKALSGDVMFDGSSIDGFTRIEESDMVLLPDFDTFRIYPWEEKEGKIARVICDTYMPEGSPFSGCPRIILKKAINEAQKLGYTMMIGPELEFFLFQKNVNGEITKVTHDKAGYFDMAPVDEGELARRDIVNALHALDFEVEASHHEVAFGQHEIDFKYGDALKTADNVATFKFVVKRIAKFYNLHATFMPKPIYGINGSGMHCHQSLFKGDENIFHDQANKYELSETALFYIGGIMHHAKALSAIVSPLVNSYKRLVPGYEAPVNIAWAEKNRSPLIRVPARRGKGTRIEFRLPDPSCNPYLAFACMLRAGLDGIVNKITPPEPVNKNIFIMSEREKRRLKIDATPANLLEAIRHLKKDEILQDALGEHVFKHFYKSKLDEWNSYIGKVHHWETEKYFEVY
jgi:glutamine synthetase